MVVVVVVNYSRSRVVCLVVGWRRQALRWVGVMLEKEVLSASWKRAVAKARRDVCNDVLKIRAGYKEQ